MKRIIIKTGEKIDVYAYSYKQDSYDSDWIDYIDADGVNKGIVLNFERDTIPAPTDDQDRSFKKFKEDNELHKTSFECCGTCNFSKKFNKNEKYIRCTLINDRVMDMHCVCIS